MHTNNPQVQAQPQQSKRDAIERSGRD